MTAGMDVTGLLEAWRDGDQDAQERLLEIVYGELKRLAKAYVRREGANYSVAATALVHEAYLKLVEQRGVPYQNRRHFFGIAARAMRRILVDRARARHAAKRGGGLIVEHHERHTPLWAPNVDVLALDQALSRLEAFEPRWSHLVELRFFGGLTVAETAAALGVSPATVKRDWSFARGWLYRELQGMPAGET